MPSRTRALVCLLLLTSALLPSSAHTQDSDVTILAVVLACYREAPLTASATIELPDAGLELTLACDVEGAWVAGANVPISPAADLDWEATIDGEGAEGELTCSDSGDSLPLRMLCESGEQFVNLGAAVAPAPELPLEIELPELSEDGRAAMFDIVWGTVANSYVDPDINGLPWEDIYSEYRERALDAPDSEAFYRVLIEMISLIGDEHSRFLPPWEALIEQVAGGDGGSYEGVGVVTIPEPNALYVLYVYPGSPAEGAGIRARDRIVAIDGEPVETANLKLAEHGSPTLTYMLDSQPTTSLDDPLGMRGAAGADVELLVVSPSHWMVGEPRAVVIERDWIEARVLPTMERLPTDPGIVYIQIPSFFVDDMPFQIQTELKRLLADGPIEGIVLDVRSNPGGHIIVLRQILGMFLEGEVATFHGRNGDTEFSYPFEIEPNPLLGDLRGVPITVLIDRYSNSAAEMIAGVLQGEVEAVVIGEPSAGNSEYVVSTAFQDGSALFVANAVLEFPRGLEIEGRGVQPDIQIDASWTTYPFETDPYLHAAVAELQ